MPLMPTMLMPPLNRCMVEASDGWSIYKSLLIEPWEPNNSKKETLNRIWLLKHGLGKMQQDSLEFEILIAQPMKVTRAIFFDQIG